MGIFEYAAPSYPDRRARRDIDAIAKDVVASMMM